MEGVPSPHRLAPMPSGVNRLRSITAVICSRETAFFPVTPSHQMLRSLPVYRRVQEPALLTLYRRWRTILRYGEAFLGMLVPRTLPCIFPLSGAMEPLSLCRSTPKMPIMRMPFRIACPCPIVIARNPLCRSTANILFPLHPTTIPMMSRCSIQPPLYLLLTSGRRAQLPVRAILFPERSNLPLRENLCFPAVVLRLRFDA